MHANFDWTRQYMTAPSTNPFPTFLDRYARDRVAFVREVLGADPDPWQLSVLRDADADERLISVRSGHGVGKSTLLAWLVVHHLVCRFPQKTVCTAPTSSQLYDALWAETKAWMGRLPAPIAELFELKADRIELRSAKDESFASVRTSRAEQPEAIQGVHSDNVLLIVDEASGVPDVVFEAGAGSMSGHNALTILAGNPVRGQGFFYDTHNRLADRWKTHVVSCETTPRVSKEYIEDMRARYGEESNAYRVRVLGEFPKRDDDTVISFELVEDARIRDIAFFSSKVVAPVWGLDCARFGTDRSALAKRRGRELLEPVQWKRGYDTMELAGWVKTQYDATPPSDRPSVICVDVIGLGAGVVDRLRELNLPVRGINVSESAAMSDQYRNLRAELWFKARDWFAKRDVKLRTDDELVRELTMVRFKYTSNGKTQIESKEDIRKRARTSPDLADAFVLTFAGDALAATHGSRGSLRRDVAIRVNPGMIP